jgi:pimeloyl-ACP methyl ester carboxylesterase
MAQSSFRFRGETLVLNAEARSCIPGSFVELAGGVTHYEMAGPPDGQVVVLVHGFSVPYYIWDPTLDALARAGFRVLRYDLYGRGYSDRPDTVYDLALFVRQLANLLFALNINQPIDLVGLSMGGAIAVTFTDQHPATVRKLCLIDPVGLPAKRLFLANLVQAPVLGEWIMDLFGDRVLVSDLSSDFYRPDKFPDYQDRYRPPMRYAGFKRAILSTLRHGALGDITDTYKRVGGQARPALLIWGCEDQTIPFDTSEKAKAAMPHVEFHAIDEAGHVPHYERPEVVNPILIEFLKR